MKIHIVHIIKLLYIHYYYYYYYCACYELLPPFSCAGQPLKLVQLADCGEPGR